MPDTVATPPGYIVVEGPIGVGKTSLVKRLAQSFAAETLLEAVEENPFLERFYNDGREAAFPTQLFFLFQRSRQLTGLRQQDLFRRALVADYMLEKDRLFAGINLDAQELDLYEQVYERLSMEAPAPDLVVYLQAPVEVLLARIQKRGRPQERRMEAAYLKRLSDAYTDFFYHYDKSPLLIINAAEINPIERERDYQLLLQQICSVRSGKHYFNPAPLLL
ncbi:deoxynucleoside kinase [Sedimenticola hydrogenitrophicus]|uniref:deoxynucleoside kinase n=1 Tax=Sedimenticola hydrogenitrophicus TaxID=2967975 RepID=UPI0023B1FBB9|nr:deoxynucleoside kinase [Sedimenticola hydrogenitrophicus]